MSEQNPFENRPAPPAYTGNPFQAPAAHVEDVRAGGDGVLAGEPNQLATGKGSEWWSAGWALFREATGLWIGMIVVLFVVSMILGMIPIVGFLLYIVFPAITGGLMLGCRSLENGEGLNFGHLFAGFQKNFGQLALVGAIYLAGVLVIGLIVVVIGFGGSFGAAMMGSGGAAVTSVLLAVLIALALSIPLAMAIWFAPALVVLNDLAAVEAMKLSFRGCWRNMLPFLIFGIVGLALAIVATIPFGLGWLALGPTIVCATYVSYRDIFLA